VAQLYLDREAPSHLRTSTQGLFTFLTAGAGMLLGNLLSGYVVRFYTENGTTDWYRVWQVPAVIAAVALVMFVSFFPGTPTASRMAQDETVSSP
jgi:MFS family permease